MHIAFLNPQGNFDPSDRYWTSHPDFGGQLVYVKEVARALGQKGHHVDILTRQIIDSEWDGFEGRIDDYPGSPNVRIIRLSCGPKTFLRKELLWPHIKEWVKHIIEFYQDGEHMPDVWTGHYADGRLAGAMLSEATGRQFSFTAHSLGAQKLERLMIRPEDLPSLDSFYHFGARITAEQIAMARAGKIIVSTRQEQKEQYGHPWYKKAINADDNDRFAIVPPGVNLQIFDRESINPEEMNTGYKLECAIVRDVSPERTYLPCILASARLEPKKNHVGLVRAFSSHAGLQAQSNLLLALRGIPNSLRETNLDQVDLPNESIEILQSIRQLAGEHNLWGKITTISLEGQEELAATYRHLAKRHSIFCLPTHHEPFGLAPLEAMASGLPVVATRFGGPSETMKDNDGEYGVLVDPDNPKELAAGLFSLIAEKTTWDKFHQAGYQRVLDRYTWTRTAEGYLKVCKYLKNKDMPKTGYPIDPFFTGKSSKEPSITKLVKGTIEHNLT
jgi:sucrose-phosphate synthase